MDSKLIGIILCSLLLSGLVLADPVSALQPKPLSILSLGDSYTIGESVAEHQRWPNLLVAQLKAANIPAQPATIIARTGWTTRNLSLAISRAQLSGQLQSEYDRVTLMIGVNDQYQGRSIEEFTKGLEALLQTALGFVGNQPNRLLVLSIPDWSVSPFGRDAAAKVTPEIVRYNAKAESLVQASGAQWIEITDLVEFARSDDRYIARDGLHFSGVMHGLWAERVADEIKRGIKTGD